MIRFPYLLQVMYHYIQGLFNKCDYANFIALRLIFLTRLKTSCDGNLHSLMIDGHESVSVVHSIEKLGNKTIIQYFMKRALKKWNESNLSHDFIF
jgi:hypothetical protein